MIALVRGRGQAGVVGQDAQAAADMEAGVLDRTVAADDAVLLRNAVHVQAIDDDAGVRIGDQAVAAVTPLAQRARTDILAQRQRAGVDHQLAAPGMVADDGGEHAERDVVASAAADAGLEQVEEHVHARAHLGDALQ